MGNKIIDPDGRCFMWIKIDHPKYKYKLMLGYKIKLNFKPAKTIISDFYVFDTDGWLFIKAGYTWDGASGPTFDTISTMRASCVHDVIYQMIRRGELGIEFKKAGDRELQRIMKEDYHPSWFGGALWSRFRAGYYYQAVSLFGGGSCERS